MGHILLLILSLVASPAFAQENAPPLPLPRPADIGGAATPPKAIEPDPAAPELPRSRPEEAGEVTDPGAAATPPAAESTPPPETQEPADPTPTPSTPAPEAPAIPAEPSAPAEPPRIYQSACPAVLTGVVEATLLPPIAERQCGAQSPLSVTGVLANGRLIPLSSPATLDCPIASALPAWLSDLDSFLQATENTGVASVISGTSYMCRNVNNGVTGNLSFHALAAALDVVGFTLEDGRTVTVEDAWSGADASGRRIVRFAHDAACAHFTTTLGPEANAQHHDHLHIDLGCHGKACTARLCE